MQLLTLIYKHLTLHTPFDATLIYHLTPKAERCLLCSQVDPTGPLSNIRKLLLSGDIINTVKKFLTEKWWVAVLGAVGLFIIMVTQFIIFDYVRYFMVTYFIVFGYLFFLMLVWLGGRGDFHTQFISLQKELRINIQQDIHFFFIY